MEMITSVRETLAGQRWRGRTVFFLLAILCASAVQAQKFSFSKENYTDSLSLAKALPELASWVLDSEAEAPEPLSQARKMTSALLTGDYEFALACIDSLRQAYHEEYNDGIYVAFEILARSRACQGTAAKATFPEVFESTFRENFRTLSVSAQQLAESSAQVSVENFKVALDGLIEQYKTSDSIEWMSALELIRMYSLYTVYGQTVTIMSKVVEEYNRKTYAIETAVVETPGGVRLQTHVVRKKKLKGKLPTVLLFDIYADSSQDIATAKLYAAEGFACVVVNTRGKGIAEHEIAPFEFDGQDAHDMIDWIVQQDWSNGSVGMVGGSYLGFTQWAATKKLHPGLKTIVPMVAVGPGIDFPMNGNVFMNYTLAWIRYVTNNRITDYADFSNREKWRSLYRTWYEKGLSFRSLDSLEGKASEVFQRWLDHPSYDEFWQNMVPYGSEFAKIDIPILTTTGYFDDDQMGALHYFKQHYQYKPQADHYLVIGPYTHSGGQLFPQKEVGGYKVDRVATTFNFRRLSVEWFDFILKDGKKPGLLKDKVNFQVMGSNQWRHCPTLQEMSNDTLTFYFSNTPNGPHHTLSTQANDQFLKQTVDLADRSDFTSIVFKVIQDSIASGLLSGVSFISSPVEEELAWSGAFRASLKVEINKKDFDIVIRAYELRPDGKYFSLYAASGFSALQRASYAKDRSRRQLLRPHEKETIEIKTSFVSSKQLQPGSRLLITLGVHKSPNWQINYGSGKDVSEETIEDAKEPLEVKWYGDSYIKIPVLK